MADRYAGIAGMTVGVEDGQIVLDLSTPEQPEHTRLRLAPKVAADLGWTLLDVADSIQEL